MLFSKSFQKIFFQLILLYFLVSFISKCYIMCYENTSYNYLFYELKIFVISLGFQIELIEFFAYLIFLKCTFMIRWCRR